MASSNPSTFWQNAVGGVGGKIVTGENKGVEEGSLVHKESIHTSLAVII